MKKVSFKNYSKEIIEIIEANYPDFYNNEEFSAAISHWKHTPYLCPPIMPEYIFGELINLMYKNLGLLNKHGNIKDGPLVYQATFQFISGKYYSDDTLKIHLPAKIVLDYL